jgi:hypothetical protein
MSEAMLFGMLGISATWLVLFFCFCGIGLTFQKLFGVKVLDGENTLSAFWFGLCLVLMGLQIWHLFAPVDSRPLLFVLGLGAAGIYLCRSQIFELFKQGNFRLWWIVPFCLVLLWLANRAMAPISAYDAGLYHLSSIRWISSYPIIPGLANLHDRLGFNSSYFLFQAMLDVDTWSHRSHHLASGLLLLVVLLEIGFSAYKIAVKRPIYIYDLLRILLLAPILDQCFSQASTTSPDLAMYVIGVLISVRLCRLLFSEHPYKTETLDVCFIMILSATGITIKLSFLPMGFLASLVAVGKLICRVAKQTGEIARLTKLVPSTVLVLLILLPWISRNVILTGYPIYPIALFSFGVDWKLPPESVANTNEWIQSWARNPHASPIQVLANRDWLQGWTTEMLSHHKFDVIFPLFLFLVGSVITVAAAPNAVLPVSRYILFFFPALGMLMFWFLIAPEPRFAGAAFWYLGAGALSLAYGGLFYDHASKERLVDSRSFSPYRGCEITPKLDDYTSGS